MVHAISAVALAVVALNAASTLAYPVVFGGDALETRSESEFANIKRAAAQAALPKGPQAPGATAAGGATKDNASLKDPKGITKNPSGKAGAMPTLKAIWAPRPTTCKKGETPVAKNAKQRLYVKGGRRASARRKGAHEGASGPGSRKHGGPKKHDVKGSAPASSSASLSPAPALVPRATPATTTKGAATTASGDASAPTPHPGKGQTVKGSGKIITTTRKGRDGNSTVYHIHRATKTPCYAQETGAANDGKGAPGKADVKATPSPSSGSEMPQKTQGASKTGLKTPAAAGAKSPSKTTADPKLVARYEELLERYYGEIDELD